MSFFVCLTIIAEKSLSLSSPRYIIATYGATSKWQMFLAQVISMQPQAGSEWHTSRDVIHASSHSERIVQT